MVARMLWEHLVRVRISAPRPNNTDRSVVVARVLRPARHKPEPGL